jgi:hypothetical protein
MRKWGILISAFYALILLALIVPGAIFIAVRDYSSWRNFLGTVHEAYGEWVLWLLIAAVLVSQALLLFVSIDTSENRLKPRAHILVSCVAAAILTALLTSGIVWSLGFTIRGDNFWKSFFNEEAHLLLFWGALWVLWGIVFYLYFRNSSESVTRLTSWLLKGSILELLIVVPCHVIVRRRHDCSAPMVTSFGIATGLAIMLLSFGPSVLFLYKKRLDEYANRGSTIR